MCLGSAYIVGRSFDELVVPEEREVLALTAEVRLCPWLIAEQLLRLVLQSLLRLESHDHTHALELRILGEDGTVHGCKLRCAPLRYATL